MQSTAKTPDEYVASLNEWRKPAIQELRDVIKKHLPLGFEEVMQYGMISYVVPHSLYHAGYHCKPSDPLPFLSIASQKNHISFYHMGLYNHGDLYNWFIAEYPNHSKAKLDMGKCCVRWRKLENIPYDLVGQLAEKITPNEWIRIYESKIKR